VKGTVAGATTEMNFALG